MMNKVDPRKWSNFNIQWRMEYLTEIYMNTDIHTVYFFDEVHVQKGAARYCWWYRGASAAASARAQPEADTAVAAAPAGEKCYMQEALHASRETLTINAIIGLRDFPKCEASAAAAQRRVR